MSWFQNIIPPKIKKKQAGEKKIVPEGLWSKCKNCEAVLYFADLAKNLNVRPRCSYHNRIPARDRVEFILDQDGRIEIGAVVVTTDALKFKDSKRYIDRLAQAKEGTDENDSLIVVQGKINNLPIVVAAFEFGFMSGSMGLVVGERFVRAVKACIDQRMPFVCFSASGGRPVAAQSRVSGFWPRGQVKEWMTCRRSMAARYDLGQGNGRTHGAQA